jgi:hypothetical protein
MNYLFVATLQDDTKDKRVASCDVLGFLGCYYLFVATLQDDYKR